MADAAAKLAPTVDAGPAIDAIPRNYNFAADIIERNLKAGRADKPVYIDPRGSWTYGQLAERVDRFTRCARSGSGARSVSCSRSSTRSTGPPPSSGPSRPAWCPFRSIR
jgi:hypothetical protein